MFERVLEIKEAAEALGNQMLELEARRQSLTGMLRRMVAEFDSVPTDWGERCGYCWDFEHKDNCAWLAAKRYLEGQGSA